MMTIEIIVYSKKKTIEQRIQRKLRKERKNIANWFIIVIVDQFVELM